MVVLKMIYSQEIDLFEELQALKSLLKKKNIIIGLVESIEGSDNIIKIICDDDNYNEASAKYINLYVSNILYKIVIMRYKFKEMYQFISENFFFLKQEEMLEVEEEIMEVLTLEDINKDEIFVYCTNKINIIMSKINKCIEENPEINLDGFLIFRTRALRKDIEDIIDKVIDRYIIEKEYKEFIRLLKYFVDIQESKLCEVNIFVEPEGGYNLRGEDGEDILEIFMQELSQCKIGVDANIEDVIISGLITSVPQKIIIHREIDCPNKEFLDTIKKVFGDRVSICKGCKACTSVKVLEKNSDMLSN